MKRPLILVVFILTFLCLSVIASDRAISMRYVSSPKWESAAAAPSRQQAFVRILIFHPAGTFTEVDGWITKARGRNAAFAMGEGYAVRRGNWRLVDNRIEVTKHLTAEEGMAKQALPGKNVTEVYKRSSLNELLAADGTTYRPEGNLENEKDFLDLLNREP